MSKKLDEKIRKEIQNRVFERENELKRHQEQKDAEEANIEALAEVTSLSIEEIDQIANKVRLELLEKEKQKSKNYKYFIAAGIIIALFVLWGQLTKKTYPPLIEKFDTNELGWPTYNTFDYHKSIENGKFKFEAGTEGWNYWSILPFDLPQNYSVEAKSTWISGKYSYYGIILYSKEDYYALIQLHGDGSVKYAVYYGDQEKWKQDTYKANKATPGDGKTSNTQKITVTGTKIDYYVNGKFMFSNDLLDLDIKKVGIFVGSKQKVEFDYLKIWDNVTSNTISDENFDDNERSWSIGDQIETKTYFENGKYIFKYGKKDNCSWASIPFTMGKNYTIKLSSTWKKGESEDYGFMLLNEAENYYSFELKSDGNARCNYYSNGKYQKVGNFHETGFTSDGSNTNIQKVIIKGSKYEYFLNNKLIEKGYFSLHNLNHIALRVCNIQTVEFDNLEILPD